MRRLGDRHDGPGISRHQAALLSRERLQTGTDVEGSFWAQNVVTHEGLGVGKIPASFTVHHQDI